MEQLLGQAAMATPPAIETLYMQLFGVGLLWVTIHCGGMCGPIMAGLAAHSCKVEPGATKGAQIRSKLQGVFAYQGGRAVTYAALGALGGALGQVVDGTIQQITQVAGLLVAVFLIGLGLFKIWGVRKQGPSKLDVWSANFGKRLGRMVRRVQTRLPERGWRRMWVWGLIMGLLPCMLMFWVLSLSIASTSIWHGMGLMLMLVVLTTPVLGMAACSTSLLGGKARAFGERALPWMLILSGVWTGMIAAAANGWIEHLHIPFEMWGKMYTFMLW